MELPAPADETSAGAGSSSFLYPERCPDGSSEAYSRMDWRYWEGVTFSHFLKVVQKLVSLLKPVLKAIFLMEVSVDFSRYFAAESRVLIRY